MVNFRNFLIVATTLLECTLGAPSVQRGLKAGDAIPDSYIVTLKSTINSSKAQVHIKWVNDIHKRSLDKRGSHAGVQRRYDGKSGFQGYSGNFDAATIKAIKDNADVAAVEANRVIQPFQDTSTADPSTSSTVVTPDNDPWSIASDTINVLTQIGASWGLAAVSHRDKTGTGYLYDTTAGNNTYAYVIDTGVRLTHTEFEGRATNGWTAFGSYYSDGAGHGTHVAGTIAGKTFGVAKKAQIVSVKVLDDSGAGTTSGLLAGINWAVNDIINKGRTTYAVINMSLAGDRSTAINTAVNAGVTSGAVTVVAAGNENQDCANSSPASAAKAITVGAINTYWGKASFSNWGSGIDLFAPGVNIQSASSQSDTAKATMSGTSMSSPHVAGLVLYAMSVYQVAPADVPGWIVQSGTANSISGDLHSAPNLLANNANALQNARR